jgi:hypothetical protein
MSPTPELVPSPMVDLGSSIMGTPPKSNMAGLRIDVKSIFTPKWRKVNASTVESVKNSINSSGSLFLDP